MTHIQMLHQRVLLKLVEEEPSSVGKLIVPETVAKNISKGIVVSVDEGKLRVNDLVMFDNRQSFPVTIDSTEFLITHETQIVGIINRN